MANEQRSPATATTQPKVIGLGAPISVHISFDIAEIPALLDAIGDQIARYGATAQINARTIEPAAGVDPRDWRYHVGELQRMLGDVEQGAQTPVHGRFSVLWPTAMAHDVVHGAVDHAAQRATAATAGDEAAALTAAQRTLQDFEAVDDGGLPDIWL